MKLLTHTRENTDTHSDKNYKRLSNSYKLFLIGSELAN